MVKFITARFSLGVPEHYFNSRSSLSIDIKPTVRPLIIPAKSVQTKYIIKSFNLHKAKPA